MLAGTAPAVAVMLDMSLPPGIAPCACPMFGRPDVRLS
jgi:hypothetical protein